MLGSLLTVEDVAPLVHMKPWTLRDKCNRLQFPHRKLPGTRRILIVAADVDAWAAGEQLEVKLLADGGRIVTPKRKGGRR